MYTIIQYSIWPFLPHGDGTWIFSSALYDWHGWNMLRDLWSLYIFHAIVHFGLTCLTNVKECPTKAAKVRLQVSQANLFHKSRYVCTVHWLFSVHKDFWIWNLELIPLVAGPEIFSLSLTVAPKPSFCFKIHKGNTNFNPLDFPILYAEVCHTAVVNNFYHS